MKRISLPLITMLIITGIVVAAPSLYVTKEDPEAVSPVPSWTGPDQDPHAVDGQWFYSPSLQSEVSMPKEFHDSFSCCEQVMATSDGGCTEGTSIQGYVTSIQKNIYGNITGFTMSSTITNDTSENDAACTNLFGGNALGECRTSVETSFGTMLYPVMTIEFAIIDPAYQDIPMPEDAQAAGGCITPPAYIVADDYDVAAWYGKTDGCCPTGSYCVPGWIMTDELMQGESASVDMAFHVTGAGLCKDDYRYWLLTYSEAEQADILSNRTESLKISCWVEGMAVDIDGEVWQDGFKEVLDGCILSKYSTCSVFHDPDGPIPEPASILLLGFGGLALRRFRKKA